MILINFCENNENFCDEGPNMGSCFFVHLCMSHLGLRMDYGTLQDVWFEVNSSKDTKIKVNGCPKYISNC